jgi:hypothetical protein
VDAHRRHFRPHSPSVSTRALGSVNSGKRSEDEQARLGIWRVEKMYRHQCEWRVGEYAVEHGDRGDDSYDDEHEHSSDPA